MAHSLATINPKSFEFGRQGCSPVVRTLSVLSLREISTVARQPLENSDHLFLSLVRLIFVSTSANSGRNGGHKLIIRCNSDIHHWSYLVKKVVTIHQHLGKLRLWGLHIRLELLFIAHRRDLHIVCALNLLTHVDSLSVVFANVRCARQTLYVIVSLVQLCFQPVNTLSCSNINSRAVFFVRFVFEVLIDCFSLCQ